MARKLFRYTFLVVPQVDGTTLEFRASTATQARRASAILRDAGDPATQAGCLEWLRPERIAWRRFQVVCLGPR